MPETTFTDADNLLEFQRCTITHVTRIEHLESILRQIATLGGNLPDGRLETRTGPNDAVMRGLMYTAARRMALSALPATHSPKE